jgi:transcriptional regulator GlxA family with amidase domain
MKHLYLALLPDCMLLDVAEVAEAFRIANREMPGSYALEFVAPVTGVRSSVGLQLQDLQPLPRRVSDHSIIVVTGVTTAGLDLESSATRKLCTWLATAMKNESVTLMSVCAGALFAAQAGLLRGVQCTTHHDHVEQLASIEADAIVHADRIFVEDGRIFTSAGVTAGLDLALHIIGNDLGHRVAAAVARTLVVYQRRSGSDPALSPWVMHRNHIHPAVHRVQEAVTKDPAADWTAERLASVACMSPRNLARLFSEHAACSPLDYVQRMRVALARELIGQSRLDLERVAERSGFSSAHHLRRVWRRWESRSPTMHRGI